MKSKRKINFQIFYAIGFILLLIYSISFVTPFLWSINASLKTVIEFKIDKFSIVKF